MYHRFENFLSKYHSEFSNVKKSKKKVGKVEVYKFRDLKGEYSDLKFLKNVLMKIKKIREKKLTV